MEDVFVFSKKRDFNELLTGTVSFLKLELKNYFRVLLPLYLPLMLVSLAGIYFLDFNSFAEKKPPILLASITLVNVWYMLALNYSFIKDRIAGNNIEIASIRKRTFYYLGKFLCVTFVIALPMIPMFALLAFLHMVLLPIAFIFYIVFGIAAVYIGVRWSLVFAVINNEGSTILDSLGKSFKLIKGYWWQTFGAIIIITLVTYVVTLLFSLLSNNFHFNDLVSIEMYLRIYMAITMAINLFISIFSQIILCTYLTLNYFNLVERKEAPELIARIEEIGSVEES